MDSIKDWTGASRSRLYFARDDNHTHDDDRSNSEEDSGGNPKTFKRVCTRFAERTSMQGIPYVHVSTAVYAKVAWSIIFTVGLLAMIAHLYLLFSDYYSYETKTQVDLGFSPLAFPAVTFCNVNRIRKSKLTLASSKLQSLVDSIQPEKIALAMEDYRSKLPPGRNQQDSSQPAPSDPSGTQASVSDSSQTQPAGTQTGPSDPQPTGTPTDQNDSSNSQPTGGTESDKSDSPEPQPTGGTESDQSDSPEPQPTGTQTGQGDSSESQPTGTQAEPNENDATVSPSAQTTTKSSSTTSQNSPTTTTSAAQTTVTMTSATPQTTSPAPVPTTPTTTTMSPSSSWSTPTTPAAQTTASPTTKAQVPSQSAHTQQTQASFGSTGLPLTHSVGTKPTVSSTPQVQTESSVSAAGLGATTTTTTTPGESTTTLASQTGSPAEPKTSGSGPGSGSGSGSGTGTESGSGSPPESSPSESNPPSQASPPGNRRRKRQSWLAEAAEELSVRVKRFITGFDVNQTSDRYEPTDAAIEQNVYSGNKSVARKIEDEVKYLYSIEPRQTRVEMGHQIDDMLVSCSFAGIECGSKEFQLFQTAEYGNCYTIENNRFTSLTGGPADGLELILYLDKDQYLSGVTTSLAGIQLQVHEPGSLPSPYRKGFAVSAATESFVALRQVNVYRESSPYGDCQDGDNALTAVGIKYTRTLCQWLCVQEAVSSRCGCYDATYEELTLRILQNENISSQYCTSEEEISCLVQVESEFQSAELNCECWNPCSESDYTKTSSSRSWPSDDYATVLAQQLCSLNESNCDAFITSDVTSLRENFIKLTIYFEDLNYEDISENPDYELTQFISDVGGTIGLWIGLSIISFFEVLQFLYETVQFFVYVRPRQRAKARRKARMKKKLQRAEEETVRPRGTMSTALTGGFQPNGMRQLPMMNLPKDIYSDKI